MVSNQEMRHQSLVVVDNLGMARLCMGEEQLVRLRSCVTPFLYLESNGVECCEQLWCVPVLNLPVSGYVMKDVSLAVIKPVDQPIEMERDVKVMLGAFDEEEEGKVCDEAVIEISKDNNKKTFIRDVTINYLVCFLIFLWLASLTSA